MGLDTTHNAWHGGYGNFMNWRREICRLAGYPPLDLMQGFYEADTATCDIFCLLKYDYPTGEEIAIKGINRMKKELPIKWDNFKPNPLIELLTHSDCDGYLNWSQCCKIADELEKLLPNMTEDFFVDKTVDFIKGLRLAHSKKEKLEFR